MLKLARHAQIETILNESGQVTVGELNARLNVSEATIRRDLDEMDGLGLLRRTHGGAVRLTLSDREPPLLQRATEKQHEKQRIGRLAATLVRDEQTVFLGSGSTVQAIVPHLRERHGLTVISNSLPVLNMLADREDFSLVVIGGMFRPTELSMVGHIAEAAIRELRADIAFMGMRAVDPRHGFTSDYLPEALTDRAILQIATRRVVLADHTKFGRVTTVFLAPVTAADVIISDTELDPAQMAALRDQGLEVLLA